MRGRARLRSRRILRGRGARRFRRPGAVRRPDRTPDGTARRTGPDQTGPDAGRDRTPEGSAQRRGRHAGQGAAATGSRAPGRAEAPMTVMRASCHRLARARERPRIWLGAGGAPP
ncbi:hypothetical protein GCM10023329_56220 [Streptomyces sanyensis]|uniref:Uncharacterized protein n=1 Tax=Streptomyces sanyensis TaxID=568869 RepID=A0ABP9BJ97_9ACTN